jgi:membrane-bound lytic murein transglycosylase D
VTPRIVLPADKVDTFHENLQKLDEKSLVSWKTYYPKKGESLESIAKKHGMTVSYLREVNGISARSRSVPSLIVVPANGHPGTGLARLPIMYAPPIPITYRRIYHTVKPGETLASIARRYRVSLEDMKRWNPKGAAVGERVTMEVRAKPKGKPRSAPKGKPRKQTAAAGSSRSR